MTSRRHSRKASGVCVATGASSFNSCKVAEEIFFFFLSSFFFFDLIKPPSYSFGTDFMTGGCIICVSVICWRNFVVNCVSCMFLMVVRFRTQLRIQSTRNLVTGFSNLSAVCVGKCRLYFSIIIFLILKESQKETVMWESYASISFSTVLLVCTSQLILFSLVKSYFLLLRAKQVLSWKKGALTVRGRDWLQVKLQYRKNEIICGSCWLDGRIWIRN